MAALDVVIGSTRAHQRAEERWVWPLLTEHLSPANRHELVRGYAAVRDTPPMLTYHPEAGPTIVGPILGPGHLVSRLVGGGLSGPLIPPTSGSEATIVVEVAHGHQYPGHQVRWQEDAWPRAGLHESEDKLASSTIDRHRAVVSIQEELEAVDWYDQRVDATDDAELASVLAHNRDEEKEHAAMTLEWLRRNDTVLDRHLRTYLFTSSPIVGLEAASEAGPPSADAGSVGVRWRSGTFARSRVDHRLRICGATLRRPSQPPVHGAPGLRAGAHPVSCVAPGSWSPSIMGRSGNVQGFTRRTWVGVIVPVCPGPSAGSRRSRRRVML